MTESITKFLRSAVVGPLAAMLLAAIAVSLSTDRFLQTQNLMNVSLQVSSVAIRGDLAIGDESLHGRIAIGLAF